MNRTPLKDGNKNDDGIKDSYQTSFCACLSIWKN